jgi:hypothetical protein
VRLRCLIDRLLRFTVLTQRIEVSEKPAISFSAPDESVE